MSSRGMNCGSVLISAGGLGYVTKGRGQCDPAPHLPSPFLTAPISRLLLLQPVLTSARSCPHCFWTLPGPLQGSIAHGGKIGHCGSQGWRLSPAGPLPDSVRICPNPLTAFLSVSEVGRSSCPHSHILKRAVEELSHCTDTGVTGTFLVGFSLGLGQCR